MPHNDDDLLDEFDDATGPSDNLGEANGLNSNLIREIEDSDRYKKASAEVKAQIDLELQKIKPREEQVRGFASDQTREEVNGLIRDTKKIIDKIFLAAEYHKRIEAVREKLPKAPKPDESTQLQLSPQEAMRCEMTKQIRAQLEQLDQSRQKDIDKPWIVSSREGGNPKQSGTISEAIAVSDLEKSLDALKEVAARAKAHKKFLMSKSAVDEKSGVAKPTEEKMNAELGKQTGIVNISDSLSFFADPKKRLDGEGGALGLNQLSEKYLEEYRRLSGVAQEKKYNQERLDNRDVDAIVQSSDVMQKYTKQQVGVGGSTVDVYYKIVGEGDQKKLIILHETTDMIATQGAKDVQKDGETKELAIARFEAIAAALKKQLPSEKVTSVQHIIPEVVSGRLREAGVGPEDAQAASRHICFRAVTVNQGETLKTKYDQKKSADVVALDPRKDMGVQNFGDDINCGRYVSAMIIQAAGLAADGLSITKANLKVSPAVERALHFNSVDDAKKGLKAAYVKPLSKNPSPEERIEHYKAKIVCLAAEYESRKTNVHRAYHGTNITPFGGSYGTATGLTTILMSGLGFAHSAEEKSAAAAKIKEQLDAGSLDRDTLPKEVKSASKAGELGKCVDEIIKAQKELSQTLKRER